MTEGYLFLLGLVCVIVGCAWLWGPLTLLGFGVGLVVGAVALSRA